MPSQVTPNQEGQAMQMYYNSDQFAVMAFDLSDASASATASPKASGDVKDEPAAPGATPVLGRGGFEIVDKRLRKETFIQGALAEQFQLGVQALVDSDPTEESLDDFIAGYTVLAQHPLHMH